MSTTDNEAALGLPVEQHYSTNTVADLFDVKVGTVRDWIETGQVKAIKIGRHWRIPRSEVIRLGSSKYDTG